MTATSLVVRTGGELVRLVRPLQPLRVAVDDDGWRLSGRTPGGTSVTVEGHANGTAPHLLPVPMPAEARNLEDAATQHLAGELRLTVRRRGRTLYDGTSRWPAWSAATALRSRPRRVGKPERVPELDQAAVSRRRSAVAASCSRPCSASQPAGEPWRSSSSWRMRAIDSGRAAYWDGSSAAMSRA